MRRLYSPELAGHCLQCDIPADTLAAALPGLTQERIPGAARHVDHLVLGEALRTERAPVDGMIGIAADAHRPAVLDPDEHPAADRTVAAGRRDPPVRDLTGGRVTHHRIGGVGVTLRQRVEAQKPRDAHAASLPR